MKLSNRERERKITLEKERDKKFNNYESQQKAEDEFIAKHNRVLGGNISCGFGLPKGWYPLVDKLCESIEPLLDELAKENAKIDEDISFQVDQVKEKFGGLRFYVSGANDKIYDLIGKAEDISMSTCQECSESGTRRDGGWVSTLCDTCAAPSEELHYLNLKKMAWDEDEKGFIWVNPKEKRDFSDFNTESTDDDIRLPNEEEYRNQYSHGCQVK